MSNVKYSTLLYSNELAYIFTYIFVGLDKILKMCYNI